MGYQWCYPHRVSSYLELARQVEGTALPHPTLALGTVRTYPTVRPESCLAAPAWWLVLHLRGGARLSHWEVSLGA